MAKDYSKYFKKPNMKDARKRTFGEVETHQFTINDNVKYLGKGRNYFIHTFGCQANEADTDTISGILEEMHFTKCDKEEEADFVLLNTCAIRENAENRVFGNLGRLKKLKENNPDFIIGICGCMPQEEAVINKILKSYPYVDMVFGTHNIHKLPDYLESAILSKERVIEVFSNQGDIYEALPKVRENAKKAWVNITFGCDEFCTYCIVPYTRGKERSREAEYILKEVQELVDKGYKEVTLLGQNVNSYGKDFTEKKYSFADLLDDVSDLDIARVRFTTSHPKDFDDELIAVIAKKKNLMPYIHLPVQSGNNDVLKKMNRKYTREQYLELVRKIKESIPTVSLTTDIIVGFPSETEEQFQDTLSLVKEVGFEGAYTFVYSPREGTPAAKYEVTSTDKENKERLYRLNELINEGYLLGNKRFEDSVVKVLVDGVSKHDDSVLAGYTENNKLVNFKGEKKHIGDIVDVRITEAKTWFLLGELINE